MSFNVSIGYTTSDKNALDKNYTELVSLSGTLINDTNVVNPSILLKCSAEDIAKANYMKVDNFGRDYFINDIMALTEGTCVVTAHVDVLSTYKNQIRANTGVIARQENKWNLYIDDDLFKVDSRTIIQTKQFSGGGSFTVHPHIALVLVG